MNQLATELIKLNKQAHLRGEDATTLDLGKCGLSAIPDELYECKWIKELNVSDKYWDGNLQKNIDSKNIGSNNFLTTTPSGLSELANLEKLRIGGDYKNVWPLKDFSFLKNVSSLAYLDLGFNSLNDIHFLSSLRNLRALIIPGNRINKIDESIHLNSLEILDLSSNNLSSVNHLGLFTKLRHLNLRYNSIFRFKFLEPLHNLQNLMLGGNQINDLLPIEHLVKMEKLDLSRTKIKNLEFLDHLFYLEELDLSQNNIQSYNNLRGPRRLKKLNISASEIESIDIVSELIFLEKLDISCNKIIKLEPLKCATGITELNAQQNLIVDASPIGQLSNVVELDISENFIRDFKFLEENTFLKKLNISSNLPNPNLRNKHLFFGYDMGYSRQNSERISEYLTSDIPRNLRSILKLSELKTLDASRINAYDMDFVENLSKLEHLNISHNCIIHIPPLVDLILLKYFDAGHNQIEKIDGLKYLSSVKTLKINNNNIEDIEPLSNLFNLHSLDARVNVIEKILPLQRLKFLRYLNLASNKIVNVSPLWLLSGLAELDIQSNHISELNSSITRLLDLEILFIHDNPITNIPGPIFERSGNAIEHVRNYFDSLHEDEAVPNDQIKMLFLGNSTVGKSSLIHYLATGKYDSEISSTHGIEHFIWKPFAEMTDMAFRDRNIKVSIWDFGGQEFYHATHSLFFNDQAIYMVLFDSITNIQGKRYTQIYLYEQGAKVLKNIELDHFDYHYWLHNVLHMTSDSKTCKMLIQSKADIPPIIDIDEESKSKYNLRYGESIFSVSVEQASLKKKSFNLSFDLFREKLFDAITGTINRFNWKNSRKWQEIKNKIQDQWYQDNILTYEEYRFRCQEIKPSIDHRDEKQELSQLDVLTEILHNQGVLLYFKDIPGLQEKVFVNPEWLTDCIYKVLDYRVIKEEGRFTIKHIEDVSQKIENISAAELKAILLHFKLIFKVESNSNSFIAPQYLPEDIPEPKHISEFCKMDGHYIFTLYYPDFLSKSVMVKFIATYGNLAKNVFWKYGLKFEMNGCKIVVKCEYFDKKVLVYIDKSPNRNQVSKVIFDDLYKLDNDVRLQASINHLDFVEVSKLLKKVECRALEIESVRGDTLKCVDFRNIIDISNEVLHAKVKKVFISYSHDDVDARNKATNFLVNLEREGLIDIWHDKMIGPGEEWDEIIRERILNSDIVILLVSQSFIVSSYSNMVEMQITLSNVYQGKTKIIPFLLDDCDWQNWKIISFSKSQEELELDYWKMDKYQFMPIDSSSQRLVPLSDDLVWPSKSKAWMQLTTSIRKMIVGGL